MKTSKKPAALDDSHKVLQMRYTKGKVRYSRRKGGDISAGRGDGPPTRLMTAYINYWEILGKIT